MIGNRFTGHGVVVNHTRVGSAFYVALNTFVEEKVKFRDIDRDVSIKDITIPDSKELVVVSRPD